MKSDINKIEELNNIIQSSEAVCVYFGSVDCSVCKVIKPQIKELLKNEYSKIRMLYIDIKEMPEVSSQFSIYTVPVVIIFFEGKEFIRKIRNFSISEFSEELNRPYNLFF